MCSLTFGKGEVKKEASDLDLVCEDTVPLATGMKAAGHFTHLCDGLVTTPLLLTQRSLLPSAKKRKLLRFLAGDTPEAHEGLNEDTHSTSSFPN